VYFGLMCRCFALQVSALTAVLSWTAFSAAGLAYNMDDTAAASLDPSKMHFSPPWPSRQAV
jgi:hypothetical protein